MSATKVLMFAALLASVAYAIHKDPPLFVKTLNQLQRGPPRQMIKSRALVESKWITQKLDHFDVTNERTYKMRYFINDEFQTTDSPIFIFCGGEWEAEPSMVSGGLWYDLAAQHKGLLIYSEHRYYGKSVPTSDMSTDNLKYLHVKQALADLVHLIKTIKAETPGLANSKVLLAGGSYSATMVVWFKHLYPELIVGGFASSAPLLAKVDFREYKEVVGKAIRELGGQQCYDHIQAGVAELESMFDNKRSAEARAMLRLCSDFDENNDLDVWSLFSAISNIFSGIVQYQRDDDIPYYCSYLLSWEDPAAAIANFVYWAWEYPKCVDTKYASTLEYFKWQVENFDSALPWNYQTCNEYGWYQTSGSSNQPFGQKFPATLYTTTCSDVFDSKFTNEQISNNVAQTNEDFGGLTPKIENIHMTHGALDPWSSIGHGIDDGAFLITNASHCADFGSISDEDSAEMRASKERLVELVAEWLA